MLSKAVCISKMNMTVRLNPCFNGICSRSHGARQGVQHQVVLILVLMEYALEGVGARGRAQGTQVLILVLMEYALEVVEKNQVGDRLWAS